jgi:hypothetical protein
VRNLSIPALIVAFVMELPNGEARQQTNVSSTIAGWSPIAVSILKSQHEPSKEVAGLVFRGSVQIIIIRKS